MIIPQLVFIGGVIRYDYTSSLNKFLWSINHITNEQSEVFQKILENYHADLYLLHHLTIDKIQQGRISSHEMNRFAEQLGFDSLYAYTYENQNWTSKLAGTNSLLDAVVFQAILEELNTKNCSNILFFSQGSKDAGIYLLDIESLADVEGNTLVVAKLDPEEFLKRNFYFKNIDNTQASLLFNETVIASTDPFLKDQKIIFTSDQYVNKEGIKLVECEDYLNAYGFEEKENLYYCTIKSIPLSKLSLMVSADYSYKKSSAEKLKMFAYVFLICIVIFAAGIVWLFQKRLKRPIIKLIQAMKNLGEGDLKSRYQQTAFGFEINAIGYHFNLMVDSLKKVLDDIKNITVKKEIIDTELKTARDIQSTILPGNLEQRFIEIQTYLDPAYNISGDFFDFIEYKNDDQHSITLIIADVVGRGITACRDSLKLKMLFRACFEMNHNFSSSIEMINQLYYQEENKKGSFASCYFLEINLKNYNVRYLSCGHMPALYIKGKKIEELQTQTVAIGVLPKISLEIKVINLEKNDFIVLYSDGVIKATNPQDQAFGKNGLIETIGMASYHNAFELKEQIVVKLSNFKNKSQTIDDETLLIIRRPVD